MGNLSDNERKTEQKQQKLSHGSCLPAYLNAVKKRHAFYGAQISAGECCPKSHTAALYLQKVTPVFFFYHFLFVFYFFCVWKIAIRQLKTAWAILFCHTSTQYNVNARLKWAVIDRNTFASKRTLTLASGH